MSENKTPKPGLSNGIKSMLIILGIILAIITFLIWAAFIRGGTKLASGDPAVNSQSTESAETDEQTDSQSDPVAQAREPIISMVDAPGCENVENDATLLSDFVTAAGQEGGLTDEDRQLIVDTFNKVDEVCPKDFTLGLSEQIGGGGVPIALSELSATTDWVSKARPAPDNVQDVTHFALDSRNIHCTLESNRVACSIYAYTFPSQPESCETYTQTFIVQEASDTDALCSWRLQSDSLVGSGFYANDTFACEVRDAATTVECWSQLSGKGFEINRATSRTF